MIRRIVFAARLNYVANWAKVSIHTTLGIIPAEYIPGSERQVNGGAYSYDFYIVDGDVPTPGYFNCDMVVDPFVTPYAENASCPSCFNLEQVDLGGVSHVATIVIGQCGGKSCLVMTPVDQIFVTSPQLIIGLLGIPEYANESAANASGLEIGKPYFNQSTQKLDTNNA